MKAACFAVVSAAQLNHVRMRTGVCVRLSTGQIGGRLLLVQYELADDFRQLLRQAGLVVEQHLIAELGRYLTPVTYNCVNSNPTNHKEVLVIVNHQLNDIGSLAVNRHLQLLSNLHERNEKVSQPQLFHRQNPLERSTSLRRRFCFCRGAADAPAPISVGQCLFSLKHKRAASWAQILAQDCGCSCGCR